jgi:hypothetical protein
VGDEKGGRSRRRGALVLYMSLLFLLSFASQDRARGDLAVVTESLDRRQDLWRGSDSGAREGRRKREET